MRTVDFISWISADSPAIAMCVMHDHLTVVAAVVYTYFIVQQHRGRIDLGTID